MIAPDEFLESAVVAGLATQDQDLLKKPIGGGGHAEPRLPFNLQMRFRPKGSIDNFSSCSIKCYLLLGLSY